MPIILHSSGRPVWTYLTDIPRPAQNFSVKPCLERDSAHRSISSPTHIGTCPSGTGPLPGASVAPRAPSLQAASGVLQRRIRPRMSSIGIIAFPRTKIRVCLESEDGKEQSTSADAMDSISDPESNVLRESRNQNEHKQKIKGTNAEYVSTNMHQITQLRRKLTHQRPPMWSATN